MFKRIIKFLYFKFKFKKCKISSSCSIKSFFEGYNIVGKKTKFIGKLGLGSYIGQNCDIYANIGRFCSIGSNVKTIVSTHPTRRYVSTSPVFYSTMKQNGLSFVQTDKFDELMFFDKDKNIHVLIGNDVWICDNVTIVGGIKIGDGAIIGANAVVTKDVAPYEIVVGNPAKVVRKRFDENQIRVLKEVCWWDRSLDWLKRHSDKFCDIDEFMNFIKGCD